MDFLFFVLFQDGVLIPFYFIYISFYLVGWWVGGVIDGFVVSGLPLGRGVGYSLVG